MRRISLAGFASKWLGWDVSSFLKSTKGKSPIPYIMVNEADSYRIPTYPRFILKDLSIEDRSYQVSTDSKQEKKNQNIFNSSDFIVVNTAFDSITPDNGKTLSIGGKLSFRGKQYLIVDIKVVVADYFNDYSFTTWERGIKHEGKATPYNIVIKIDLKKDD